MAEFQLPFPLTGRTTLLFKDGIWQPVESWAPPASGKRTYEPGGVANLYSGEPLLIVYPTNGPELTRRTFEAAARSIVLFGGSGGDMITGRVPIKSDRDVTEDDIQHRNLILFGGPQFNSVTHRMAEELPVTVNDAGQFVVDCFLRIQELANASDDRSSALHSIRH